MARLRYMAKDRRILHMLDKLLAAAARRDAKASDLTKKTAAISDRRLFFDPANADVHDAFVLVSDWVNALLHAEVT